MLTQGKTFSCSGLIIFPGIPFVLLLGQWLFLHKEQSYIVAKEQNYQPLSNIQYPTNFPSFPFIFTHLRSYLEQPILLFFGYLMETFLSYNVSYKKSTHPLIGTFFCFFLSLFFCFSFLTPFILWGRLFPCRVLLCRLSPAPAALHF